MAHYAFLNNSNIVVEVIVGVDENELIEDLDTETWYGNFRNQICKRTSYNAATNGFRFNYAGIGYTYDPIDDAFIAPMWECGHEELLLNALKQWECSNSEHDIRAIDELLK